MAHNDLGVHPRASPWQHGCLNVDGMAMVTPIIQVSTPLASHGWCNHTPRWSSPCQGPSLVPQNSMWIKLSFLISQNFGTGSKTFAGSIDKFPHTFNEIPPSFGNKQALEASKHHGVVDALSILSSMAMPNITPHIGSMQMWSNGRLCKWCMPHGWPLAS